MLASMASVCVRHRQCEECDEQQQLWPLQVLAIGYNESGFYQHSITFLIYAARLGLLRSSNLAHARARARACAMHWHACGMHHVACAHVREIRRLAVLKSVPPQRCGSCFGTGVFDGLLLEARCVVCGSTLRQGQGCVVQKR